MHGQDFAFFSSFPPLECISQQGQSVLVAGTYLSRFIWKILLSRHGFMICLACGLLPLRRLILPNNLTTENHNDQYRSDTTTGMGLSESIDLVTNK